MAIVYLDGGRITGLSTDAKPDRDTSDATTPALTVGAGSVFIETDTGSKYVHNGTAWIQQPFDSISSAIGKNNGIKQPYHFVHWFSGKLTNTDIWLINHIAGSSVTFTLEDAINGGLRMYVNDTGNTSPSASVSWGEWYVDHVAFEPRGSTIIGNCKKGVTNVGVKYGLADDMTVTPPHCALFTEGSFVSYKTLQTNDGSNTATDMALDTSWHNFKINCLSSLCELHVDGVLKASKTSSIPTAKMMPFMYIQSRSSAGEKYWNTTFCEAYNH